MDEDIERLAADYDGVRERLDAKVRELLAAFAVIADAEFPGRVAGASLRAGACEVDFSEGFLPDSGDPRLAVLLARSRDVDEVARLAGRRGVAQDASVRLGEGPGSARATPLH